MSFLIHLFFVVTVAVFSRQQKQKSFFLLGLFIAFFCNAHEIRNKHKHSMAFIMCFSFFSYVRAYSRNLGQHSILARKGIFLWKKSTFFEKKGPKNTPTLFNPFPIVDCNIGLAYVLYVLFLKTKRTRSRWQLRCLCSKTTYRIRKNKNHKAKWLKGNVTLRVWPSSNRSPSWQVCWQQTGHNLDLLCIR